MQINTLNSNSAYVHFSCFMSHKTSTLVPIYRDSPMQNLTAQYPCFLQYAVASKYCGPPLAAAFLEKYKEEHIPRSVHLFSSTGPNTRYCNALFPSSGMKASTSSWLVFDCKVQLHFAVNGHRIGND